MSDGIFSYGKIKTEPVLNYAPGSDEKQQVKETLSKLKSQHKEIPMVIGGERIKTDNSIDIHPPHERGHVLGHFYKGGKTQVDSAISAALQAKSGWENTPWWERAAIFLRAAELLGGKYRAYMNASTMLCQSKNIYQAEIDAVCELVDFFKFNAVFMKEIYETQPKSPKGIWNQTDYRPLEGFVFALTPFNFTSIAGNLPGAPALLGNTVVWKPAESQIYSAIVIMEILEEAGLPPGVINLVFASGPVMGESIFSHKDFAGLHFTGSTGVFQQLWKNIGNNIQNYVSYPRIVGETGGKDFVVAHPSADPIEVATALGRGAFEFQGQKCSAASRAYIPKSLWKDVSDKLVEDVSSYSMGSPEDFRNFINAVIDEKAFDKISSYIDQAKLDPDVEILVGGGHDKSEGYFIEPTVILAKDPKYTTMCEEIFGPVLTIYVYDDNKFEETLELVDSTSPYALTGAVFAKDRNVIEVAKKKLRNSAGNFYINDKPTGAVVSEQPFGGGRASGTNDKAGSAMNLYRWISARSIKENFHPPVDYRYPFLGEK